MTTTTTKICRVCGKEKPISEFGKNSQYKDGLDSRCKDCRNAYARGYDKLRSTHSSQILRAILHSPTSHLVNSSRNSEQEVIREH